ncbi:hypothetical protein [Streptococcus pluranimalium]|uniref:hypothetical protein n=1 Tax=Streptococcus pluranimalium TaxID=82348 RepID=UPI003F6904A6
MKENKIDNRFSSLSEQELIKIGGGSIWDVVVKSIFVPTMPVGVNWLLNKK